MCTKRHPARSRARRDLAGLVLAPCGTDAGGGGPGADGYRPVPARWAGTLARGETVFGLKYFLSSQSAILWMSMLFFMSTAFYWIGMFSRGEGNTWKA